jgi:hypothetical protein
LDREITEAEKPKRSARAVDAPLALRCAVRDDAAEEEAAIGWNELWKKAGLAAPGAEKEGNGG